MKHHKMSGTLSGDSQAQTDSWDMFSPDFKFKWTEMVYGIMKVNGSCLTRDQFTQLFDLPNAEWDLCPDCGWTAIRGKACCEDHRYSHTIHRLAD